MVIQEIMGNINSYNQHNKIIDTVSLEWDEMRKRILHKESGSGEHLNMKFLKENHLLTQGDIIYEDENKMIVIEIIMCDTIIIKPSSLHEMATISYEIGNRHLPLFYQEEELLVPFEYPLYRLLLAAGYSIDTGKRRLVNQLKTTVTSHLQNSNITFSNIGKEYSINQ